MNRTTLGATLLLHGALLFAAWTGLEPRTPHHPEAAASVTVSLHVPAAAAGPAHAADRAPAVPLPPPLSLQAPGPLLIAAPEWPQEPVAPAAPAALRPDTDRPAAFAPAAGAAGRSPAPLPAPSGLETRAQAPEAPALVPPALPPDHQDCKSRQVERHYPALLRERGIEGRVLVRVKVDEDGRAAEVLVQGASGWRLLDEAALQVAAACAYQPARRGEQRLMAWIEYPIRFTLH